MTSIKEKAQAVIDTFAEKLTENGITVTLSTRYFESIVHHRQDIADSAVYDLIRKSADEIKERKNGYGHIRNNFRCLVLTVCPCNKGTVPKDTRREYAFLKEKVFRRHIGLAPKHILYDHDKILKKISKRIEKILKSANKNGAEAASRNNFTDLLRYTVSSKYGYKKHYFGKSRWTWELIIDCIAVGLTIALVLLLWIIQKYI